ncbi:GLPGLI family protein [uncultured Kordia sp.]|uniref:GLPGLI family protein n=1 Tax=uncultured Kordia sp. TaxID=507699 RepID=UPI00262C0E95|nr:GLPGLI family protein [uncultured Kordia sp.]
MKNYAQSIIVFVFILISTIVNGQEFQGEATYKTSRKMDFKIDEKGGSQGIDADMQKKMNEMLQKQFQKEYKLTFNTAESLYKEEGKLAAPQPSATGIQVMVMGDSESKILYKNMKEKRYTNQEDIFGKMFLIKDSLENKEWKLGTETKFIGQYQCFKATRTIEMEKIESFSLNDSKEEPKVTKEEVTITAWYTLEIPVNAGPGMYWGLPGLILEVNDGSETIICSKIVLNPKNKVTIKEPTKGKKVNQEKFETIIRKKTKEMTERFRGNRRDGEHVTIEIGG